MHECVINVRWISVLVQLGPVFANPVTFNYYYYYYYYNQVQSFQINDYTNHSVDIKITGYRALYSKSIAGRDVANYSWTSSVTAMLNKLDLVLLKDRRFHSKSIMMYKILNNLIDIPSCYFMPSHHSLRRGYFIQLPARIDSFKFSFFHSVIKI